MNILPMGERVLIKPEEQEEKTKSGIYIPESAKEKKNQGEVLAAGTFKDGKPLPLSKGDRIIYGGYSQEKIDVDGEEFIILNFKDIVAKIED